MLRIFAVIVSFVIGIDVNGLKRTALVVAVMARMLCHTKYIFFKLIRIAMFLIE